MMVRVLKSMSEGISVTFEHSKWELTASHWLLDFMHWWHHCLATQSCSSGLCSLIFKFSEGQSGKYPKYYLSSHDWLQFQCRVQRAVWFWHERVVEWRRLVFGAILAVVCGSAGALCPSSKIRWSCSALNRIQFTVQWMYRRLRQAIIWALLVHINPAPLLQAAYVFKGNWQKNLELTFFWWPICWHTIFFRTS